ncbi:MAG: pantetheine-phosphate adenylyltransferase [Myxococcales bacterium]|nr:pantetheine-phosphate adenylyltransferase [Myxococcales bacterium]
MKRKALYPGSFDPLTYGHVNIIERAVDVFDTLVVAVAYNVAKKTLFTRDERVETIREIFKDEPRIQVDTFDGLLVHYAEEKGCQVILRGLRTVTDFEFEFQMAQANKTLLPSAETLFMMTDQRYSYYSSSLIKEIATLGGDVARMVPPEVDRRIRDKLGR